MFKIPVYKPYLHGRERQYLNECIDSTWISSKGEFITRFENQFRDFVESPFATTVCNGTVALHLALLGLKVGSGDEVIVPSLTYVASANAITYTGATPVFADSLRSTWQMDPEDVVRKITSRTKAILAVHLYGHPCEIVMLQKIAHDHGLFLIEDCAEAFGTYFDKKHVGNFGDVATYSFFGNKTITTGEGGMVVTQDPELFQKMSVLKNQGNDVSRSYWHTMIGYNYRMTNLSAAIGLAQIEQAQTILKKKRRIAEQYRYLLRELPVQVHNEDPGCTHSYWMISILADERDSLRDFLANAGVETRPFFYPVHQLPMYTMMESGRSCPIAEQISARGMNLPSFPDLTQAEVEFICQQITAFYKQKQSSFSGVAGMREVLPLSS
jgi:perosamine synthetase